MKFYSCVYKYYAFELCALLASSLTCDLYGVPEENKETKNKNMFSKDYGSQRLAQNIRNSSYKNSIYRKMLRFYTAPNFLKAAGAKNSNSFLGAFLSRTMLKGALSFADTRIRKS